MQSSSFKKKYLKFNSINKNFTLESKIEIVEFNDFYRINFDTNLLNYEVFKTIRIITLDGNIQKVQNNLFENFRFIREIEFRLFNLKYLLHQGLNWTQFLENNETRIRIHLENHALKLFDNPYEFLDEDYCLFKEAISNQKIQFYFNFDIFNESSCILISFLRNLDLNELTEIKWYRNCCTNDTSTFDNILKKCQSKTCLPNQSFTLNQSIENEFDFYDFLIINFYLDYIFVYWLKPIISIFGILVNCIIIYVMKKNENRKDFKDLKMYFYIFYNSVFNLLIYLLDLIDYMSTCSFDGIFYCPVIRETLPVQFIFIVSKFLNSVFVFNSNFTLFCFSLERLVIVNDKSSIHLINFLKQADKHFHKIILIFSFILNLTKLFEFQINYNLAISYFPYSIDILQFTNVALGHFLIFSIFVNDLLSNFVIHILIFLIDIIMSIKYKNAMEKKKKICSTLGIVNQKKNQINNKYFKQIVLFGSANFASRLPEIILFFLTKNYNLKLNIYDLSTTKLNNFDIYCYIDRNCDRILKWTQSLSKISFIFSFFVLYFMNRNFRNTFKNILKQIKRKENF